MKKLLFLVFIFLLVNTSASARTKCDEFIDRVGVGKSFDWEGSLGQLALVEKPYLEMTANSDQRMPLYIGASPREIVFQNKRATRPELIGSLKSIGEEQAELIRRKLGVSKAEFEVWPQLSSDGDPTWVFARWRENEKEEWKWLDDKKWDYKDEVTDPKHPDPYLPSKLRPWIKSDLTALFTPFLEQKDLYDKPVFGDTVWVSTETELPVAGWIPLKDMAEAKKRFTRDKKFVAYQIPQPARLNDDPITFKIQASKDHVEWPEDIRWRKGQPFEVTKIRQKFEKLLFPKSTQKEYEELNHILTGDKEAEFAGKKMRFTRKNSAQVDNQLEDLHDYIEDYYANLGIQTVRIPFEWEIVKDGKKIKIAQSIVAAILPGTITGKDNLPVFFADHTDTAFAEDIFYKTGKRISTAGANDNVTATAALMMSAKILKDKPRLRDIILLHLPGEEYPADDLGIRHLLSDHLKGRSGWSASLKKMMRDREDFGPMVLIDMVGFRRPGTNYFQVNLGRDDEMLAPLALKAASLYAPRWLKAEIRPRESRKSYLYNTDGYIYDNNGYTVGFWNEKLNRVNLGGGDDNYHQSSDISNNVDFPYAWGASKTAIATTYFLANMPEKK